MLCLGFEPGPLDGPWKPAYNLHFLIVLNSGRDLRDVPLADKDGNLYGQDYARLVQKSKVRNTISVVVWLSW